MQLPQRSTPATAHTVIQRQLFVPAWTNFWGTTFDQKRQMDAQFKRDQPMVYEYAVNQDKELFSGKEPKIRPLACYLFAVFWGATDGKVPAVTNADLAEALKFKLRLADQIDDSSDNQKVLLAEETWATHPQPELMRFIIGWILHREDAFPLVPEESWAALEHLDIIIRAFETAVSRGKRIR